MKICISIIHFELQLWPEYRFSLSSIDEPINVRLSAPVIKQRIEGQILEFGGNGLWLGAHHSNHLLRDRHCQRVLFRDFLGQFESLLL